MQRSFFELSEERSWSFWMKSCETSPLASVNWKKREEKRSAASLRKRETREGEESGKGNRRTHVDDRLVERRGSTLLVHDGRDTLDRRDPRVNGEGTLGSSISVLDEGIPRSSRLSSDLTVGSSEEVVVGLDLVDRRRSRLGWGDVLISSVDRVRVLVSSSAGGDRRDGSSSRRKRTVISVVLGSRRDHSSFGMRSVRIHLGVVVLGFRSNRVD